MAMEVYYTFSKDLRFEPHHQMLFSVIPRTLVSAEVQSKYSTALADWSNHCMTDYKNGR